MRSLTFIVFFFLLLIACKDDNRIPRNILSKEKMQEVLWDMMRADQFLAEFILKNDSSLNKTIESTKMYQQVLAIHDISQEKFNESFSFYQSHPALLKTIMDSLNKKPVAVAKNDSLRQFLTEDTIQNQKDTIQKKPVFDTIRKSVKDPLPRHKSVKDTSRRSILSFREL